MIDLRQKGRGVLRKKPLAPVRICNAVIKPLAEMIAVHDTLQGF